MPSIYRRTICAMVALVILYVALNSCPSGAPDPEE
ncbi:hypothetical protein LMG23994_00352 [Cupriavidus pinatubonensis]|uniref:Lipoprotein n=1 Tax=Cupriavidus pinatubonensis TaxID=248026 RepID=A0ABM8WB61_9BURK|nr:hypothetical protein LMG23994_00352 [Cupriavidus pinatubonensis]